VELRKAVTTEKVKQKKQKKGDSESKVVSKSKKGGDKKAVSFAD
jgi:hypothetical protein